MSIPSREEKLAEWLAAEQAMRASLGAPGSMSLAQVSELLPQEFFDGAIDEVFLTAETLTPAQIKRMYETGKRALESGTEGVASSATCRKGRYQSSE